MSETYNPIVKSQAYQNSFFSPIPISPQGYAIVLSGQQAGSGPLTIQAGMVPPKGSIRKGKYNWMTQVDLRPHHISFPLELPGVAVGRQHLQISPDAWNVGPRGVGPPGVRRRH